MIYKIETMRGFIVEPKQIGTMKFPLSQTAKQEDATEYPSALFARKCALAHGLIKFWIVPEKKDEKTVDSF